MPSANIDKFVVVDMSGQHTVDLSYCGCVGAADQHIQLLRISWFPASIDCPWTAYTFNVLNSFQLVNLQGKLSLYDFYLSLVHKSDNADSLYIKVYRVLNL